MLAFNLTGNDEESKQWPRPHNSLGSINIHMALLQKTNESFILSIKVSLHSTDNKRC